MNTVNFSVANAAKLFDATPPEYALNDLAGSNPLPSSFDWGLPLFYGRHVFTALENHSTSGGAGPYVAY